MRLKLGRPDIARYSDRFDVPAAPAQRTFGDMDGRGNTADSTTGRPR